MSLTSCNKIILSFVTTTFLFASSLSFAEKLKITWDDISDNEKGFIVEKRFSTNSDNFELLNSKYLTANTTEFIDSSIDESGEYCYRIVAYNNAGKNPSDDYCLTVDVDELSTEEENTTKVDYNYKNVSVSYRIIDRNNEIEVEDTEFYSFKDQETFNDEYSANKVVNTSITADGWTPQYGPEFFSYQEDGVELSNGYVAIPLNERSNLSFDITSDEQTQTATIYMLVSSYVLWQELPSIFITVGDTTKEIKLSKKDVLTFFAIDITFQGNTPVTISTDLENDVYNSMTFSALVFDSPTTIEEVEEETQYASLVSVETNSQRYIDVSNSKFMTSRLNTGNNDLSDATIESLSFEGYSWPTNYTYRFIDDSKTYYGYRGFKWDSKNGVLISLKSGDSQINTVSLYFAAANLGNSSASFELVINDKTEVIEINKSNTWVYYKVDIEFEGNLTLNLKPIDNSSYYGSFKFAGLTLD